MYSYTVQAAQGVGTRGSLYSQIFPASSKLQKTLAWNTLRGEREREIQDKAQSQMECFPFGFIWI